MARVMRRDRKTESAAITSRRIEAIKNMVLRMLTTEARASLWATSATIAQRVPKKSNGP